MTDLLQALPDFPTHFFTHLLPSLDKHHITLNDLLTVDASDVAKRAQLPPSEVGKLANAALAALHAQLGVKENSQDDSNGVSGNAEEVHNGSTSSQEEEKWQTISTLDASMDSALNGGFPLRYLSEVVGESGAGKTQLLLTLLLSVQLSPSHGGLSAPSVYISTESALSTPRLSQLLRSHPRLSTLPENEKPSLNRVLTMQTPDLESQEHILRYQLPVTIRRHGVKLIVIDSIAANYRAEFERRGAGSSANSKEQEDRRSGGKAMAARRAQLLQLGALLRDIARKENVAVVVANQVADRFDRSGEFLRFDEAASGTQYQNGEQGQHQPGQEKTPMPASEPPPAALHRSPSMTSDPMTLDHQQRWFTGWGDVPGTYSQLKTPSLGLVWANQIAARVALIRSPVIAGKNAGSLKRWMRVVFAAWAPPTEGMGLEFEIRGEGLTAVRELEDEAEAQELVSKK